MSIQGNAGMNAFSADKAVISSESVKALNLKHRISRFRSLAIKAPKFKKLRSGRTVELPDLSQLYLLEFPKDSDVKSIVDEYSRDPSVEYASPNYIRKIFVTPNDPYYISNPSHDPNQWALYKIGLGSLEAVNTGWEFTTGESTVKVAILDTGVNYNHEDLQTKVDSLEGNDFADGAGDPMDHFGHGTHVAGIVGAATNNGTGVAGVDWTCRIIPIKVLNDIGSGSDSGIISGIFWAVSKEADVMNMSFGGGPDDPALEAALSYAGTSDCVLAVAAGNNGSFNQEYPAAYATSIAQLISVAATGPNDEKAWYSNYSGNINKWVKVSAPGGDSQTGLDYYREILSTIPTDEFPESGHMVPIDGPVHGTMPNASYGFIQGTSMAAPFVAGLAALVRAKFPTMEAADIAQRIINSADNIDAVSGFPGRMGSGRINAFSALGGLYGNITYPISSTVAFGNITILGSASGEGFSNYKVEYGLGANPGSYILIGTSETSVSNGALATFDSTGLDGPVTIRLTLNDLSSKVSKVTFQVGSPETPIVSGNPQYGPNPFNPKKENIMIMYTMTANADVYIYFFDIAGHQLCRKWYPSGSQGGSSGTNRVFWDGKSDYGGTVANGVYLFRIFSNDRTIGKGKIMVIK